MRSFCKARLPIKFYNSLRTQNSQCKSLHSVFLMLILSGILGRICTQLSYAGRRTSYTATPRRTKLKGASMTVEAAFAVPLFIFCIINLLFGIQVMETSCRITAALHEAGNEICSYGYAINNVGEGTPAGIASTAYAYASVYKSLGEVTEKRGGIRGGRIGISYLGSSVMSENDIVKLRVTYSLKFPVDMGLRTFRLGNSYYGRAWTGYDVTGGGECTETDDPIVYVTATGTVYHTDIQCSHLNPSIRPVDSSAAGECRNKNGAKYYQCELCGTGNEIGTVYVTEYGNRYHRDINCSGIKRNIMTIHLSETGGKRACMTCGG